MPGKLELILGNALKAPEAVLVHGCNLKGKMGKGFALAVKERWPRAFSAYEFAISSGALRLGNTVWASRNFDDTAWIVHAMTQTSYDKDPNIRNLSYDALDVAIRDVAREAKKRGEDTIAMPPIGVGFGGGKWSVVRPILEEVCRTENINIKMYVLTEQQLAELQGNLLL